MILKHVAVLHISLHRAHATVLRKRPRLGQRNKSQRAAKELSCWSQAQRRTEEEKGEYTADLFFRQLSQYIKPYIHAFQESLPVGN